MKKVLTILLALAMVFSMSGVVSAEETPVTYQVGESYTADLPVSGVTLVSTDDGYASALANTVGVRNAQIAENKVLSIRVNSGNDFNVVATSGNTVSKVQYKAGVLGASGDYSDISNGTEVLRIGIGDEYTTSMKFYTTVEWTKKAKISKEHSDTLTFTYEFIGEDTSIVNNEELLVSSLTSGKDVIITDDIEMESATTAPYGNKYAVKQDGGVIDGNGNELHMECYGDDYGIMTSGGTIKNLVIQEGCRAVMIMYPTEDVILDNVNIGGDGVLYPINTGEAGSAGVNLIVINSVIAGWTSYSNIESASFTNVEFKQGTYYNGIYGRVLKPYVNTALTECSFIEHMNLDLSSLASGHKVTIKDCTVNGQAVTLDVFTVPENDDDYDADLFTVDLPSWASSVSDCIVIE